MWFHTCMQTHTKTHPGQLERVCGHTIARRGCTFLLNNNRENWISRGLGRTEWNACPKFMTLPSVNAANVSHFHSTTCFAQTSHRERIQNRSALCARSWQCFKLNVYFLFWLLLRLFLVLERCGAAECFRAKLNWRVWFPFGHIVYFTCACLWNVLFNSVNTMSVCVCVRVLGCKSMISCFWFVVNVGLIRTVLFSYSRIHTHNICLPLGAVCKSDQGVEYSPFPLEEISVPCPPISLFSKNTKLPCLFSF